MDFDLTDEQVELQRMCQAFADKEIRPFAAGWSDREEFPSQTFCRMGELGLGGMLVPEQWGGVDAGFVSYVAVMEVIGAADQSLAAAWNAHTTIGTLPLVRYGTDDQKRRWLVPLAKGERIGSFGLTEPGAGSDAAGIQTRATRGDGGWVVTGNKTFISNAGTDVSLGVTILARTSDSSDVARYGAFFIPDGTSGYSKSPPLRKLGWHAMDTRTLYFDDCWIPDDNLIGDEGNGLRQFLAILDPGRISVAALGLSLASAALTLALGYVKERKQFGRKLAEFQAIQHELADMATSVDAARWMTYRAASLADAGRPFGREAAMAKLYTSQVANAVASAAVQLHGGYGWMRESEVARFYADAKILEIGEGTSQIQRNVIARSLGC